MDLLGSPSDLPELPPGQGSMTDCDRLRLRARSRPSLASPFWDSGRPDAEDSKRSVLEGGSQKAAYLKKYGYSVYHTNMYEHVAIHVYAYLRYLLYVEHIEYVCVHV